MLSNLRPFMIRVARRLTGIRVTNQKPFREAVEGKSGLEIGGPSGTFKVSGILPLYPYVTSLDNCVFSTSTTWEGSRAEGSTFLYELGKPPGFNYIREATELKGIPDGRYDFLLSAHNLEHLANPVKALKEWKRVLRPGGSLILILPHYKYTFDNRRTPTPVSHMLQDFATGTDEHDLTHLDEVLQLHDLTRDPGCKNLEHLRERASNNFGNRCMHHHVFDESNSQALLATQDFKTRLWQFVRPHHLVLLAG